MNAYNWWVPVFTLALIAAVLPAWIYFVDHYTGDLPVVTQFFASLVLPAMATLFLASWLGPG